MDPLLLFLAIFAGLVLVNGAIAWAIYGTGRQ